MEEFSLTVVGLFVVILIVDAVLSAEVLIIARVVPQEVTPNIMHRMVRIAESNEIITFLLSRMNCSNFLIIYIRPCEFEINKNRNHVHKCDTSVFHQQKKRKNQL